MKELPIRFETQKPAEDPFPITTVYASIVVAGTRQISPHVPSVEAMTHTKAALRGDLEHMLYSEVREIARRMIEPIMNASVHCYGAQDDLWELQKLVNLLIGYRPGIEIPETSSIST